MNRKKAYIFIFLIIISIVIYIIFSFPKTFSIADFNQQTKNNLIGFLKWSESTNAIKYKVIVSSDKNNVIDTLYTNDNSIEVNNLNIKKGSRITFDVIAYNKFNLKRHAKTTKTVTWQLDYKEKVSPIKSTRPSGEIGINRAVRLSTSTEGANIYYTTDGSMPSKNSKLYTGSIYIDRDMTIKAMASCDDMFNSDVLELNYKAIEKKPAIYLSPSIQDDNFGVSSVGYTNEMAMMNKVSDYIEEHLKQEGIIVYRNDPNMSLEEVVDDSSTYDVDMHLAIHSNQHNKTTNGVETWVHNEDNSTAIRIATAVQESLMRIYYDKGANRGVKYSTLVGGMRETNPKKVTNGVLVEIAFHDNYDDAKWIVDHQKQIGYTIADAIISYFE